MIAGCKKKFFNIFNEKLILFNKSLFVYTKNAVNFYEIR